MPGVRLTSRGVAVDKNVLLVRLGREPAPAREFGENGPSITYPGGRTVSLWNNLGLDSANASRLSGRRDGWPA